MPDPRPAGRVGPHRESHAPSMHADLFFNLWIGHDTGSEAPEKDVATGYREWDGTHGITDFGMDYNGPDPKNFSYYPNGLGDCGWAAPDHGNILKTGSIAGLGTFGAPKWNPGIGAYFAYGVSQGEVGQFPAPATQPDNGVDNQSWLHFLWLNHIIDGYVEVPPDKIDIYAPVGCGLLTGVKLDDQAQTQFSNHQPWDGTPDPQLGHDVWLCKTHTTGGIAVITWAAVQECTLAFRQNNVTDCWLITDSSDPRMNDPALQAALQALSGTGTV